MSGYNNDSNPSTLGQGAPGNALSLLGGGGGSSGGSGMVGGAERSADRFALREAFKTNNLNKDLSGPVVRAICGPFRAATMAGDKLGRVAQSAGGANQVTNVRAARAPGWRGTAGSVSNANTGQVVTVGGLSFTTGTGPGQTPIQSGNPKYVYDGSDYTRFKRLSAKNKNYNDSSFGGAGKSNMFIALNRVRG
jgi:hypothetical protein